MVNDIYAIYESYSSVGKVSLPGIVGLRASANNTERQTLLSQGIKPANNYTPGGPAAGESDESKSKIQKEIDKIVKSITTCAEKADYAQMIMDCKKLKELADQAYLIKK